jgi:hypothetical protein
MIAQPLSTLMSELSEDVQKRLSALLKDVVEGKTENIRTPLLKELTGSEVLEKFDEEVFNPLVSRLNGTLSELEEDQKEKFGPRSIQKPWSERRAGLLSSYDTQPLNTVFDNPVVLPGSGQLRPAGLDRVYGSMKRSTSAGLPYLIRKGLVIDEFLPLAEKNWPCVLFTRTQEEGKTRDVMGYPIWSLAQEGKLFLPFFELFKEHPCLSAYGGPDIVDESISRILYTKDPKHVIYSEDLSRFDQTVSPEFSQIVFGYIAKCFQSNADIDALVDFVSDTFVSIPYVTPDGVLHGKHGIPSGSWFTNVIGSYVHLIVQNAVNEIHQDTNQVMGDDGVQVLPPSLDLAYITDVYAEFGLSLNEEKTFVSEDEVLYLQRYYSPDYIIDGVYRGIYPVYRALNRLIHMERWTNVTSIKGADYFSIRTIAILENLKWHPMFRETVKWVYKQDRYQLRYSDQSLKQYIRTFQPKTSTTIKNQYSDNLEGIQNFETIKILKTL